ncbi:MAG: hypothetical protein WCG23_12490 [bacterium]
MNVNDIWLSVKTLSELKNVTPRAIRSALPKKGNEFNSLSSASPGKYIFRETQTLGGKSYEILLSSLEPKLQEIY